MKTGRGAAVAAFFVGASVWAGGDLYEKDLATAQEKAKKEEKAVLVNWGGPW